MKFATYLLLLMFIVVLVIGCFGCGGRKIEQEVKICRDASHFKVYTYVYEYNNIGYKTYIYVFDTWLENNLNCFEANKVDSLKKSEYKKAQQFIKKYDSVQKLLK